MSTVLTIPVQRDFDLTAAVNRYGYYALAPNRWDGERSVLHRPVRDGADRVVRLRISAAHDGCQLRIRCGNPVAKAHHAGIKQQVRRMLRIDERFDDWYRLHPAARRHRFARLFRSPTLFEDIVKTVSVCNMAWSGTIRMNQLLCEHIGTDGDFPTPTELARMTPARLAARCKVGYRAERLVRLARDVCKGRIDLAWFEDPARTTDELIAGLRHIYGIGPYAAANIAQHLGRYDQLGVDSETVRLFRDVHKIEGSLTKVAAAAERYYAAFAPYQFLAYWFDLWGGYERDPEVEWMHVS